MHNIPSLAGLVLGLGCLFSAQIINAASCNADKYVLCTAVMILGIVSTNIGQLPSRSLPNSEPGCVLIRCCLLCDLHNLSEHDDYWVPQ